MERDPRVFLLGEDISANGGALRRRRRPARAVRRRARASTRRSRRTAIVGVAVGAAMTGMRPVAEIMFMDFMTLAMDQIVNHAAKMRYMYAGQYQRAAGHADPAGAGRGYGGQPLAEPGGAG